MNISIVGDNLASDIFRSEHGLSFLVETDNGSALFDTGQSGIWLENMRTLGKDPDALRAIALSHGHYDHTGGLPAAAPWMNAITCYCHPDALQPKYAADPNGMRSIGIPDESARYSSSFVLGSTAAELLPGVTLSGEIPLRAGCANPDRTIFFLDECRQWHDTFRDEQCLILQSGDDTGLLLGCSHRGVENNVLAAMEVAGTEHFEWVAGGMHLGSASDEYIERLASFFDSMDVGRVICCHCTGDAAFHRLNALLPHKTVQGCVGMEWALPESNL